VQAPREFESHPFRHLLYITQIYQTLVFITKLLPTFLPPRLEDWLARLSDLIPCHIDGFLELHSAVCHAGALCHGAGIEMHRLREAMIDGNPTPMGGQGKSVQADET
jgi:hypothetical protein